METSPNTEILIKQNKKLRTLIVTLIVFLLLALSSVAFFYISNLQKEIDTTKQTETPENEDDSITTIDLNLGSNIVLKDMSDITSISITEEVEEDGISAGIISIKKDVAQNTTLTMTIIDKTRLNSWTLTLLQVCGTLCPIETLTISRPIKY